MKDAYEIVRDADWIAMDSECDGSEKARQAFVKSIQRDSLSTTARACRAVASEYAPLGPTNRAINTLADAIDVQASELCKC